MSVGPNPQEKRTAQEFMLRDKEVIAKDCPSVIWDVLQESTEEILYEWRHVDCSGWDDQYGLSKIIIGRSALHRVAYATKVLPLAEEKRSEWMTLIEQATVEAMAPAETPP